MTRLALAVLVLAVAGCGGTAASDSVPWTVAGDRVECPGAAVQPVGGGTLCDWACIDYSGQRVRLSVLFEGPAVKASAIQPCSN